MTNRVREPPSAGGSEGHASEREAALAVVRAYIDTFNGKDIKAFEGTLHFPNMRHADGKIFVMEAPTNDPRLFEWLEKSIGWDHTGLDAAEVIQCGPDKVHVAVRVTRRRADDSPIHSFDSLYVVTREEGRWAIKVRSSYAPEQLPRRNR